MSDERLTKALRRLAKRGNVYCRLEVASLDGKGVRLSSADVDVLMRLDDAISTVALNDAAEELGDD